MGNQEMQFADPDWKPSQQLDTKINPQEQEMYQPQPINADYREQNQWRTAAQSSSPQQEGYTGLHPYEGPIPTQRQGGNVRQRPYRRRGRGPWFWIILAFIIFGLMSGGFHSFNDHSFDHNPFNQKQIMGKPIQYTVSSSPTIVINDTNGNVQVNVGQSSTVVIQPVSGNNFLGDSNNIQPTTSQIGNTINASVPGDQQGSVNLQVTVPQGADLNLHTDSGNININGVDGQMTLNTNSGDITASNDVIRGTSAITSDSGNIGFDGTLDRGGFYLFKTSKGNVDLTVPSSQAFHIDASTSSGSIDKNDFTSVNVTPTESGSKASGDVGTSSQFQVPKVTITIDHGDINLQQR